MLDHKERETERKCRLGQKTQTEQQMKRRWERKRL